MFNDDGLAGAMERSAIKDRLARLEERLCDTKQPGREMSEEAIAETISKITDGSHAALVVCGMSDGRIARVAKGDMYHILVLLGVGILEVYRQLPKEGRMPFEEFLNEVQGMAFACKLEREARNSGESY